MMDDLREAVERELDKLRQRIIDGAKELTPDTRVLPYAYQPMVISVSSVLKPKPIDAAERQRIREEAERERQRLREAHEVLLKSDDLTARKVAELHSPDEFDGRFRQCQGCDYDGYDGERPAWPCRTWDLIADVQANV